MVIGQLAVVLFASTTPQLRSVDAAEPLPIVGGQFAQSCEFPSAVSILEGDETPVMCSGTLVHPEVVAFAAHCVNPERPIVGIGFGEEGQGKVGPQRTVGIEDCVGHPQYFNAGYPDIAYCVLSEPVLDVPRVPILAGCELDVLQPDLEVTIVGYGSTFGHYVDGELETEGVGPKRYTTQSIDYVDAEFDEVYMLGPDGSQSACFGDSGGPALVEMSDGTWRVFGAASRLYDPGGFPGPAIPGNFCGVGVIYGLLTTQLEWLEVESGRDLTPCHDEQGDWSPSEDCGQFPMAPGVGGGSWDEGCGGGPVGGGEPLCEDVAGTTSGGSTGEPPDESSSGDSTTRGTEAGGTSGSGLTQGPGTDGAGDASDGPGEVSTGDVTTAGQPSPSSETGEDSSSSGGAGLEDETPGCGCRTSQRAPLSMASTLLLVGLGYRRRRR